jgi:hypothetical protein
VPAVTRRSERRARELDRTLRVGRLCRVLDDRGQGVVRLAFRPRLDRHRLACLVHVVEVEAEADRRERAECREIEVQPAEDPRQLREHRIVVL